MVLYLCHRCGYETKHKGSFVTHVNRKNICKPILANCSIENVANINNIDITNIQQKNIHKNPQNLHKNPQNDDPKMEKNQDKNLHNFPQSAPQFSTKIHNFDEVKTPDMTKANSAIPITIIRKIDLFLICPRIAII